ncbi:alpha/beta-hydrolase [Mycena leptocephala]|nr:alpha/beta-hydrolase [Mycena leptocephala]
MRGYYVNQRGNVVADSGTSGPGPFDSAAGESGCESGSTEFLDKGATSDGERQGENAVLINCHLVHKKGQRWPTPQGFSMYDWVAQHPGGIIAVSITYRLTLLGFLGGPVVAAEGDLNAGLLDQRAGLEWIQRHISKFRGDPGNVTIYGEGAGGASVVMQVVAYGGTKPVPFNRATGQSIGFGPTNTAEQTDPFFTSAAGFIGCPASGTDAMPCLRNAFLGAIVSAISRVPNGAFAPVIEGPNGFLPDLPSRLITAGKINNAEFVGGHCTGDGKSFAGGTPDNFQTDDDIRQRVFSRCPGVSNTTIDRALAIYPEPNAPRKDWFLAQRLTEIGVKNVFSFSWNAPDTVLYNQTPYRGAAHTSDIYYLLEGAHRGYRFGNAGNTFTPFHASEAVLAKEAVAYWTSFAATGNPSTDRKSISPVWESFIAPDSSHRRLMLTRGGNTATNSTMETISEAEIQRCQFWMSEAVTAETRV